MSREVLSDSQIEALQAVANLGASNAAAALGRLTGRRIGLEVGSVRSLPLRQIATGPSGAAEPQTCLSMRVEGDARGNLALIFSPAETDLLLGLLLGARYGAGSHRIAATDEMARSALKETGNVLGGAYLSAVGDLVSRRLLVSVPTLTLLDPADLRGMLREDLDAVEETDLVLEASLRLPGGDGSSAGRLMFMPHPMSLQSLLESAGDDGGAEPR